MSVRDRIQVLARLSLTVVLVAGCVAEVRAGAATSPPAIRLDTHDRAVVAQGALASTATEPDVPFVCDVMDMSAGPVEVPAWAVRAHGPLR